MSQTFVLDGVEYNGDYQVVYRRKHPMLFEIVDVEMYVVQHNGEPKDVHQVANGVYYNQNLNKKRMKMTEGSGSIPGQRSLSFLSQI